jgi:hypothetical protein
LGNGNTADLGIILGDIFPTPTITNTISYTGMNSTDSMTLNAPSGDITLDAILNINLNAPYITTNGGDIGNIYWMPFNLTNVVSDTYYYGMTGTWEKVTFASMTLPVQIFASGSPPPPYRIWKIDFAINQFNMSTQGDASYAMYVEIVDSASNTFTGTLFNINTPYTAYKLASNYSDGTNTPIENYVYTDFIDLLGCIGGACTINFYRYGSVTTGCSFKWVFTLSPTNSV